MQNGWRILGVNIGGLAVKKFSILLLLLAFCTQVILSLFEPFIVQPTVDATIEGLRKLERFSNIAFIKEGKAIFCYALLEVYIDGKGLQNIIVRKEISAPFPVTGTWQFIMPPVTGWLTKTTAEALLMGSLGSSVGLIARTQSTSLPTVYTYDREKKSWQREDTLPIIEQERVTVKSITGSEDIWWVKTCDLTEQNCSILEISRNIDHKKTSYTSASITPDNQYAWLISQRISTNLLNIKDLTDPEDFTQEIELPKNMPAIEKFIAVDDKNAFFIGSSEHGIGLYNLQLIYTENTDDEEMSEGVEVKTTLIQTSKNFLHKNSPLAIYKGQLAVGSGTTIYLYEPQVKEPSKQVSTVKKTVALNAPAKKAEHVRVLEPKTVELPLLPQVTLTSAPDEIKITKQVVKKSQPTVQKTQNKPTVEVGSMPAQVQPTQAVLQKKAPVSRMQWLSNLITQTIIAARGQQVTVTDQAVAARSIMPQKVEVAPAPLSYLQRFKNWLNSFTGRTTVTKRSEIIEKEKQAKELSAHSVPPETPPTSPKQITISPTNVRPRNITGK